MQAAIDLVGAPATTSLAFDFLTKGGKLIIVGLFGGASSWPIALIPMKAMSIIGSYVGNLTELQELMDLVRAGKVPPMPVHRHALAEADSVLASLRQAKVVGRAVSDDRGLRRNKGEPYEAPPFVSIGLLSVRSRGRRIKPFAPHDHNLLSIGMSRIDQDIAVRRRYRR